MNKERRKVIERLVGELNNLRSEVETIKEEEQEFYDNMPENIQNGEKGARAQEVIDSLESVDASISDAQSALEDAAQ